MKTHCPLGNSWQRLSFFVGTALLVGATGGRSVVAAPIKVACVGDNMTHSDQFPNNRETQPPGMQEYPRKLQDLMGAGYDVRNFGDCCASVIGGYVHSETHPYVSGSNYKNAVAFLPDIVVIGPWGRHDWGKSAMTALASFTVPAFQTGYEDIINKFQALSSKPKIIVSNLVPLPFGNDGPDGMMNLKTSPQRDVILALAAKYSLQVVDTFTAYSGPAAAPLFIQPPTKDSDGEHTSDAGSTKMAQMFAAALMGMGTTPTGGQSGGLGGSTGNGGSGPATGGGGKGGSVATTGSGGAGGATVSTGTGGDTTVSTGGIAGTGTGGTVATGTGGTVVVSTGGVVATSTGGALQGTGGSVSSGSGGVTVAGSGGSNSSGSGSGGSSGTNANDSGGSSCAIGSAGGAQSPWGVFVVVALFALARRRSRQRAGRADPVR